AGSTSLKFKLFDMPSETVLATGRIERVGSRDDAIFHYDDAARVIDREGQCIPDYRTGVEAFMDLLLKRNGGMLESVTEIERVGFKTVVSKGYFGVHELTEDVLQGMRDWMVIARTHSEPYLEVIGTVRESLPDALFIGSFETGFHTTIPLHRRIYDLPYEWYEQYGIQRLGYHGASHGFIADTLSDRIGPKYKAISCHLGGSCSICAIEDGKSVDTSFGMSLQTGVIHGSRTGDMDCDLILFLQDLGMTPEEIEEGMKRKGGMLGISGVSADMRYIQSAAAEGNERARLAMDRFTYDIVRYIGAFYAVLGGLDTLVFTGGIGERSAVMRYRVCDALGHLGVTLDDDANAACSGTEAVLSVAGAPVTVQVIPTNEEAGIARRAYAYVR
ncbi:acetate/propionate family kinase, partial [Eubacteriales bacterium OttesenSCG-928-A19]|nr:acetate/propionate family kinase [Eubacteriales bacterium OttesenSCG-928-A19]